MLRHFAITGDFSERVPPVLIPNTEVKLLFAENTWLETARKDRTSPGFNKKNSEMSSFFHLWRVLSAKFFKLCAKTDVFAFRPEITCAVRDAHSKDHRAGLNKKLNVLILEICC